MKFEPCTNQSELTIPGGHVLVYVTSGLMTGNHFASFTFIYDINQIVVGFEHFVIQKDKDLLNRHIDSLLL